MNQRDQELLDKQLHGQNLAVRSDGVMILAILAVFFVGMTLGGFLTAYTDEPPMRIASNDAVTGISVPQPVPPIAR